jgi:di/tripeptidase
MDTLLDRFLRYVKIDTQSQEDSTAHPSTPGQMQLARLLKKELQELGLSNVRLSDKGYLMAELPANTDKDTSNRVYCPPGHQSRCVRQKCEAPALS